jgi:DNA-binding winged helix-turn-helix (wHTH) protein
MPPQVGNSQVIRFATFEVDLFAQELRKAGLRLKLSGQPFQVLAILLEQPGTVVTREELQERLWPDTFVDVDHNLNTAINKIREVLGDSAESPRFVETLPRRGYRFIAPIKERYELIGGRYAEESVAGVPGEPRIRSRILRYAVMAVVLSTAAGSAFLIYKRPQFPGSSKPRALTRLTFGAGLQMEPTWSPDGRYIAYTSDRDSKLDVWVQQVSGGDPVRVTHTTGNNWQPSWSPDGKYSAYRSEGDQPGLFVIPALGGEGLERRIATFGYRPRWSPDSSQILFQTLSGLTSPKNSFYVVGLDGSPPRGILADFQPQHHLKPGAVMWHPDGKNFSVWVYHSLVALRAPEILDSTGFRRASTCVGGPSRDYKTTR